MATKRNIKSEKDVPIESPAVLPKAMQAEKMKANPGAPIPAHVLYKLFGFTVAMLFGPLGCYYITVNYLFPGSTVLGASIAAVVANIVLVGFVFVAMKEDDEDKDKDKEKEKEKEEKKKDK
ncbi:hypothetical protein ABW19_dt0202012 [Dactylella cylindrospora]|nr:hypothetical protein ABW19_dt0202012 [Dactylella cylindrospora]